MSNLTLAIDGAQLRRARLRAVSEGTSVNALVREFIVEYADPAPERRAILASLDELVGRAKAGSGPQGRTWTREALHDR
ncbi:MAG: hypothetical protein LBG11_07405 [Bifidobacteriaceae bacterium]|nr:hypothetical protein [Bifidobacteriaceae bacterium]